MFWCALSFFCYSKKMDQGNCITFCVKNEIKHARTFEMSTVAFGEPTMNGTQVQLWYNRLKESREDVNDNARPNRPRTSTTDENIEVGSCQAIFMDVLGKKRAAAKIVPKLQNFEQNNVAWTSLRRC